MHKALSQAFRCERTQLATAALATEAQVRYLESLEHVASLLHNIVEDPALFLQNPEDDRVAPVVLEFMEAVSGPAFREHFEVVEASLEAGVLDPLAHLVDHFLAWRASALDQTSVDQHLEPTTPSTPRGETSASAFQANEQSPQTASPPQKKRKRPSRKTEPEPAVTRSSRGGRSVSTSEGGRLTRSGRGGTRK